MYFTYIQKIHARDMRLFLEFPVSHFNEWTPYGIWVLEQLTKLFVLYICLHLKSLVVNLHAEFCQDDTYNQININCCQKHTHRT